MTEKITTVKAAVLLSLALHAGFGWWALQVDSPKPSTAAGPPTADHRLLVQLLTLPTPDNQNTSTADVKIGVPYAVKKQIRKPATTPQSEPASGQPASAQLRAAAVASPGSLGEVQTPTPAAAAQPALVIDLDTRRAVRSAEQQRRKSSLAAAVDAAQSENSQTPKARAFAKLAPVAPGIVSETVMADGTRLIRFSAGGCMRVVNPSSRNHDDTHKSAMENC